MGLLTLFQNVLRNMSEAVEKVMQLYVRGTAQCCGFDSYNRTTSQWKLLLNCSYLGLKMHIIPALQPSIVCKNRVEAGITDNEWKIFISHLMCAGVVPQHPPTIFTKPSLTNS